MLTIHYTSAKGITCVEPGQPCPIQSRVTSASFETSSMGDSQMVPDRVIYDSECVYVEFLIIWGGNFTIKGKLDGE